MGNCFERCCGRLDKRKYLRTRYNVERDFSIEFENLMDDEAQQDELPKGQLQIGGPFTVSSYMRWAPLRHHNISHNHKVCAPSHQQDYHITLFSAILPKERLLLANRQYGALEEEQRLQAVEIEAELVRQEEELRMEEEAYYEAKREAARVARQQKQKEFAKSHPGLFRNKEHWNDDSEWEIATGDEDFENFLESVKARSLAARTRGLASQVPIDAQSTSSSRDQRDSHTEASSIDLEWEHEAGMTPLVGDKAEVTEDDLSELAVSGILKDLTPDVLEWDMDFASEHMEKRSLLSKKTSAEEDADR